jgi:lysylphosphatidylglycerol synthetase-like protein (DUF2156 family)
MQWNRYAKALVALVGALLSAGLAWVGHGPALQWANVATGVASAGVVFLAPNTANVPSLKWWVSLVMAALVAVQSVLGASTGATNWAQLVVAVVSAVAVYMVPNTAPPLSYSPPPYTAARDRRPKGKHAM